MDFTAISMIAVLLLTNVVTIYYLFAARRKSKNQATKEYIQALSALLAGDRQSALENLKLAAKKDTGNIDAYLHIGNLLRESNELQSALKIHKQQTVREDLTTTNTLQLNQALALDLMALGQYDKALEQLLLILGSDKKNLWALKKQVMCYERLDSWLEAFQVTRRIAKLEKTPNSERLALYKAQECRVHLEQQREKEGKACFKEAIKQDAACGAAYYYLGTYYQQHQRLKEALAVFKEMLQNVPEMAHLPFENLQEILYELGRFSDIEQMYRDLLKKNPGQKAVKFVLAGILQKKGETSEALDLYQQIFTDHPDAWFSLEQSLQGLARENQHRAAVTFLTGHLESKIETVHPFRCGVCNYRSSKPFWYCPQCFNWNSMNYQF